MAVANFPNSPAVNQTYTSGGRSWVWNGRAWQSSVSSVQVAIDAKVPQDTSGITEAVLNGSEALPVWRSGFLKTTVAKIGAWLLAQSNIWTGLQILRGGANFGAEAASTPTDLAKHIALYGTTYGFTITGGRLNIVADPTASHVFMHGSTESMFLSAAAGLAVARKITAGGGVQIGELSPVLKVKVVSGTLSATAGDSTNAAHGLASGATILAVLTAVNLANGKWWMQNTVTGPYFHVLWDDTYVSVYTTGSSSTSVGRPFKTTILYTA